MYIAYLVSMGIMSSGMEMRNIIPFCTLILLQIGHIYGITQQEKHKYHQLDSGRTHRSCLLRGT